jgi:ABC transport system ATP-binding/permease protein
LRHELKRETESVGSQSSIDLSQFEPAKFDTAVYNKTASLLDVLRKMYIKRFNLADQQRDKVIRSLTSTPEAEKAFDERRDAYYNETIGDLVKNLTETHRIIEKDGKLIQKIYPVYKDPDPDHSIDFTAQFYMPRKHFLSNSIDTLYFNLGVIWSMSLVLALTLYFDVLRRIVDGISNLSSPIPKRA